MQPFVKLLREPTLRSERADRPRGGPIRLFRGRLRRPRQRLQLTLQAFNARDQDGDSCPGSARLRLEFALTGPGRGLDDLDAVSLSNRVVQRSLTCRQRDLEIATLGRASVDFRTLTDNDPLVLRCVGLKRNDLDRLSADLRSQPHRHVLGKRETTLEPHLLDSVNGAQSVSFRYRLLFRDRGLQPCARFSKPRRPAGNHGHRDDRCQRGGEKSDCE